MQLSPAILKEAAAAAQPIFQPVQYGGIRGPALVYEGWNGRSCGFAHNFPALQQAAAQLGIPLYVINGEPGQALDSSRPGIRLNSQNFSQLIENLDRYHLLLQDPHVRLIDRSGNVVGPEGLTSGAGAQGMVSAFQPYVQRMRGRADLADGPARA